MGVRRESVELSLSDVTFTSGMAKAAAATALLNHELDKVDGTSVRANRSTTALGSPGGGINKTGTEARKASSDLDRYTGRLNLLATAATTLGPALLPIGATAIPALTSLTAGLGVTVGAVGTAVLAFHGLGDALTALNQYQLDPTDAHLKKLHQTLGQLSPAAQDLVMRLDSLGPVVKRLQRAAQNGLFPGVNEGLNQVLTLLPEVETVVSRIATEMGALTTQAGVSLAHDADWQRFFHWLETDAIQTLDNFARATGNFIAGIGSMLVGFRGLDRDFTTGLLRMSQGFREWAAALDENSSFQDFVDYVRENGPAVGKFFAALGDAFVGLARATAPWGSAVLPLLTDVAHIFALIADSPIGPPLFAAAAGMMALNRATALLGPERLTKVAGGMTGLGTALRTLPGDIRAANTSLGTLSAAQRDFNVAGSAAMSAQVFAAENLKKSYATLGAAAKTAAGPAGMIALIDGMGRATTAASTLEMTIGGALTGFAIGNGPGALIGTISGLLLAYAGNSDTASEAARNFARTLDEQTGALTQNSRAWALEQIGTDNLAALKDAGVNLETLTTALVAGGSAWDAYRAQMSDTFGLSGNSKGVLFRNAADDATVKVDELASTIKEGKASWQLFAEAGGEATASTTRYTSAAGTAIITTAELAKKLDAQRDAARKTGKSFMAFGSSLDDTKVSLGSWITELQKQADALRDFTKNAQTAAKRGLRQGLIKELEAAGPAGALRLKQLANASDSEIKRANRAWKSGQDAIRAYTNMKVPPKRIDINSDGAISALEALRARLIRETSKPITQVIQITQRGADSKRLGMAADRSADGSTVPKTGLPYADRHLYLLADGEEVISNRFGQADRHRSLLKAINAGRLADGGTSGGGYVAGIGGLGSAGRSRANLGLAGEIADMTVRQIHRLGDSMDDLSNRRLAKLGTALERATKIQERQTQAAEKAFEDVKSRRAEIASGITSSLAGDLWGSTGSGSVFSNQLMPGSIGAVNARLQQQTRDANEQTALEKQLRARGVSGDALQEVIQNGGLSGLRSFAASSNSDLQNYQKLFTARNKAIGGAADTGAALLTPEFNALKAAYDTQTAELRAINRELRGERAVAKHRAAEATKARKAQSKSAGHARSKRR